MKGVITMKIDLGFDWVMRALGIKKRKPSLLKELMDNPEEFKLEGFIEGEEIIVKIKKKES